MAFGMDKAERKRHGELLNALRENLPLAPGED